MTKEKEKLKFIFPNILAKFMKNVNMETQMTSSMISMSLIMCGMFLMAIYLFLYANGTWVYKGLILLNLGAAFIFISSFLITTYQQYISYMTMAGIDPEEHKKEIRKRGNIFKRIKLAIKARRNRKKIESNPAPQLVKDSLENMIKIKKEELEIYNELKKDAKKLKENLNK